MHIQYNLPRAAQTSAYIVQLYPHNLQWHQEVHVQVTLKTTLQYA